MESCRGEKRKKKQSCFETPSDCTCVRVCGQSSSLIDSGLLRSFDQSAAKADRCCSLVWVHQSAFTVPNHFNATWGIIRKSVILSLTRTDDSVFNSSLRQACADCLGFLTWLSSLSKTCQGEWGLFFSLWALLFASCLSRPGVFHPLQLK